MKKCVLLILCACTFLMAMVGCKKNESSPTPPVALADSLPDNSQNPYDSFGYWHNVILDTLDVRCDKGELQDLTNYSSYAGSLCKAKGWINGSKITASHEEIAQNIVEFTNDPNGFLNRLNWSDSVKSQLEKLFTMIDSVGEAGCTFQQLKRAITGFEQDVLESPLPQIDKEVILKASSTARFSGYRWSCKPKLLKAYEPTQLVSYLQMQNIPLSMARVKKDRPGIFKRVGRWIAVTSIDIMGAVHYLSAAEGAVVSGYAGLTMDLMDKFH
ncbi:MAG TPA: hypothetical protein PK191_08520 [Niabella sp.]|mgnify:CR=1 FL=1|nr:hypothetical protein [Niabella sp.]HQX74433.1 hypothetical protein [Chitinophagaceae bacterium]HQX21703.1 hypothetical protein [Niabella sp.]HRB36160.1 hypothetical protein [Niabella sp.]HRB60970.1 hypothetical protein [Niabella sp.]